MNFSVTWLKDGKAIPETSSRYHFSSDGSTSFEFGIKTCTASDVGQYLARAIGQKGETNSAFALNVVNPGELWNQTWYRVIRRLSARLTTKLELLWYILRGEYISELFREYWRVQLYLDESIPNMFSKKSVSSALIRVRLEDTVTMSDRSLLYLPHSDLFAFAKFNRNARDTIEAGAARS